ncbi:MAG: MBL fold metallo-hydrolase, partial [Nitrospinota bacterium]
MITLGKFELYPVSDGFFRLDGGSMFGVVPKVIWEKTNPADSKNRVRLGLRPLVVNTEKEIVLIDTGIGGKGGEKFSSIYGVERSPTLSESLMEIGLCEKDITLVIDTHLHFDHAGGNTFRDETGAIKPAFPNARYIVQKGEWEEAVQPSERTKASYLPENFLPVMESGQMECIEGDQEILSGISVFKTSGHNRHIQLVKIESGGESAVFLTDIIPTRTHMKLPFIMGYDLFPLDTL